MIHPRFIHSQRYMRKVALVFIVIVWVWAPTSWAGKTEINQEGTNPTSAWQEGQVIEDRYRIYLDEDAPAGSYGIAVGWYLLETMQRLPVLDENGVAIRDHVMLSGLTVNP